MTVAAQERPYRRQAGQVPLPGYTLLEPLGRGGFGEVWKCEAPGGLHKAIKFVSDDPELGQGEASLKQEYEAFQHIKAIRHPFLLTLERVELAAGELIMVMELADQQLQDRFAAYTAAGHPGVPRGELLGYLADAAEMLDHIASKHGLQHLDIKPANLFLVCERVKVGDFGLVRRFELAASNPGANRGLTPRYVAPEILHGRVDPRSDQYCLALVYQELLTGTFPYSAKSAQQMMMQHVSAIPNLTPLPASDRAAVAKALSKAPTDRFGSCLDFIRALVAGPEEGEGGGHETWSAKAGSGRITHVDLRQARLGRPPVDYDLPAAPVASQGVDPGQLTGRMTRPQGVHATPSRLLTPTQRRAQAAPEPDEEVLELISLTASPGGHAVHKPVQLPRIWSVLPVDRLVTPSQAEVIAPDAQALIESIVLTVCPDGRLPTAAGTPARQTDGTWMSRFPVRAITGTAQIRLAVLQDGGNTEVEMVKPDHFVIRRAAAGGMWGRFSGKKSGLEVVAKLPAGGSNVGEARLTGQVYGQAEATLIRAAEQYLPEMMEEVRHAVQNAEDRRKSVRVPTDMPVLLVPVGGDGTVGEPFDAKLRDLSLGGLCCEADISASTAYVYTVFCEIKPVSGWAILTRLTRASADVRAHVIAGRFRVDL